MTFNLEELMVCGDPDDFYTMCEEHPGLWRAHAAWQLACQCGHHDCFYQLFDQIARGQWIERGDVENLLKIWEDGFTIISGPQFHEITIPWVNSMKVMTERRFAQAVHKAWKLGPPQWIMISEEKGQIYVGPDDPPPEHWIPRIEAALNIH